MSNNSKPNFLYIGASKAGSSWIFECMREHPEVYVPEAKDLQFFDRHYRKGLDWYFSYFNGKEKFKARGELSHDYFLFPDTAEKIREDLGPNLKFILSLREPLDKMISSYKYAKSTYLSNEVTFDSFFWQDDKSLKAGRHRDHNMRKESALYAKNIEPFLRFYPKEKFLILFFDDLKNNPGAFIRKIYDFLGVNPEFEPSVLNQKILASHKARNTAMAHFVYDIAGLMRKMGLANMVGAVKRNPFFNKLLYKKSKQTDKVVIHEKERIKSFYLEDLKQLEAITGLKVPRNWW